VRGRFAANAASRRLLRETYGRVREYAGRYPVVVIPSHDGGAGERLEQKELYLGYNHDFL